MHPILNRYFPGLYYLKKRRKGRHLRSLSAEQVFTQLYQGHGWLHQESASGPGSTLEETETLRQELPRLFNAFKISTVLDLPCGDLNWIQQVPLRVDRYIGADIVQALIEANQRRYADQTRTFLKLDLLVDDLPPSDLVLCRDCLPHLDYHDIFKALKNLARSEITYLLATTYTRLDFNLNIVTGQWRPLNFLLAPFHFPPPLAVIDERSPRGSSRVYGKSLGLWKITDLPSI